MKNYKILGLVLGLILCNNILAQKNNPMDLTLSGGIAIPFSNFGQNTYKNGGYAKVGHTFDIEYNYNFQQMNFYLGRQGSYMGAALASRIAYTKNPFNINKYVKNQQSYMGRHMLDIETEAKGYQILELMIGLKIKLIYKRTTYPYFKCMFGAVHVTKGALQTKGKITADEGITFENFSYKLEKQTSNGFAMLLGMGVKRKLNQSFSFNLGVDFLYSSGHSFIIEPTTEAQVTESITIVNMYYAIGLTYIF